jgi:hypothetical protein
MTNLRAAAEALLQTEIQRALDLLLNQQNGET